MDNCSAGWVSWDIPHGLTPPPHGGVVTWQANPYRPKVEITRGGAKKSPDPRYWSSARAVFWSAVNSHAKPLAGNPMDRALQNLRKG